MECKLFSRSPSTSISSISDFDIDERFIEEVGDELHDHAAAGINLRGMSASQNQNFGKVYVFW